MSSNNSLLTDNSMGFEAALEQVFSEELHKTPAIFPDLLNPTVCSPVMLPHLASEKGVAEWESSSTESEHRKTIENAWKIKRLSGTADGIKLAVDAFDFNAEVVPWYQQIPVANPYQFDVVVWRRDGTAINHDIINRMLIRINEAKSERDNFELILSQSLNINWGISVAVAMPVVEKCISLTAKLSEIAVNTSLSISSAAILKTTYSPINLKAIL